MVEVNNISKRYGSHIALDGVSFTMEPGTIYGLLGPNGAGKSTTMNIMTGYIAPSGGEVSVDGYDIYEDAKMAKSRIGYLPENPPLYQDMTVHEYLMFVAELKGIKRKERYLAVESAMEDAGVLDVVDQLIRTLSKGYRQRVGFAGAIVNDPEVIILDEPTVGLDPKQIIEFREKIRELGEEHIVLISSHILSEISEVCDHVFIISGGKLIVDDDVCNLDKYAEGGNKVHITIKGDAAAAADELSSLPGVKSVEVVGEDNIVVEADSAQENMTEQLSLALMQKSIPILGLREEKDTLEQIFLEVTEKEETEEKIEKSEEIEESEELEVTEESKESETTEESEETLQQDMPEEDTGTEAEVKDTEPAQEVDTEPVKEVGTDSSEEDNEDLEKESEAAEEETIAVDLDSVMDVLFESDTRKEENDDSDSEA